MTSTEIANASKIMLGSTEATAMYIGSTLIWTASQSLPYDAEIEYLLSDGSQYIDTGIKPTSTLSFSCKFYNTNNSGTSPGYGNVFGSRISSGTSEYQLTKYSNGSVSIGTRNTNIGINSSQIYTVEFDGNNSVTVNNGTPTTINTSTIQETIGNIILFGISQGSSTNATLLLAGKIYSCSFGTMRDFIPVRVGLVGYMYDRVSGQLFGNSGSGSFTLGPDINQNQANVLPTGWTELLYISSTSSGEQYIDLDIKLYETLGTDYDIAIKYNAKGRGGGSSSDQTPTLFGCQLNVSPYPGTFIRIHGTGTYTLGRYIGGSSKDNTLANINTIKELPVQTSPNKNVTNINNSNKTHSWGTSLFCAFSNDSNSPFRFIEADLYYFKLFVGGTLVRDLIPCKDTNNVVGMYDVVNNVFYTSPNGAAFVAGPTV